MSFESDLKKLANDKLIINQPLKKFCTFGCGGRAKYYISCDAMYFAKESMELAKEYGVNYKIIGNGSNLLFSDGGYDGLIINASPLNDIFLIDENKVRAMSGASLTALINFSINNSLEGLERLSGIPATVGGATCMNASAFNRQTSDCIEQVECIRDGKIVKYYNHECKFGYRTSRFLKAKEFISSVIFNFKPMDRAIVEGLKKNYLSIRSKIQPMGKSCGSTFKNVKEQSAGYLIETAGLKGFTLGGAKVSEKHANFIINYNKATSQDIFNLISLVKERVYRTHKILLEEEVEYVGRF